MLRAFHSIHVDRLAIDRIDVGSFEGLTHFRRNARRPDIIRPDQAEHMIDLGVLPCPIERRTSCLGCETISTSRALNDPTQINPGPNLRVKEPDASNHFVGCFFDDSPLPISASTPVAMHPLDVPHSKINPSGRFQECDLLQFDGFRILVDVEERLRVGTFGKTE
jgi:hypothetical protein